MPFTARRPRSCLSRRAHSHGSLRGPREAPWLDVGWKRGTLDPPLATGTLVDERVPSSHERSRAQKNTKIT
eukprot:252258-Prymnesium_polylepis.1